MTNALQHLSGLYELLVDQPLLRLIDPAAADVEICGTFKFDAKHDVAGRLRRDFELRILVPSAYPRVAPSVFEIGRAIPREADFHINSDGSLCLATAVTVAELLRQTNGLSEFIALALVPYLYAVTARLELGKPFVFGERAHGWRGLAQDLAERFAVPEARVRYALSLMLVRRRHANKRVCPCGCEQRLGRCATKERLWKVAEFVTRLWVREQMKVLVALELPLRGGRRTRYGRQQLTFASELTRRKSRGVRALAAQSSAGQSARIATLKNLSSTRRA